jgi:hypothetical protein
MRKNGNTFRSNPAVRFSSRFLAGTLVVAGLMAVSTSANAAGPFPDNTPPRTTAMTPCPSVAVVGFRGSGEAFDDGTLGLGGPVSAMTTELRRQIPGISVGTSAVSYPAVPWLISFTENSRWALYATVAYTAAAVAKNVLGHQYADSVATGANDGSSDIRNLSVRCPATKIVVSGYSQGGQALRASLRKLDNTTATHVKAVVLFGDAGFIPQESGVTVIGDPQRQGKGIGVLSLGNVPLGSRFAGRVLSDCKDTDPICQASYSNAYTIGVHLTYGSSSDSFLTASWLKDTLYPPVKASQAPCETFVADTTIPDGTVLAGGSNVTKTWSLHNCGSSSWSGVKAVRVSGSVGPASFSIPALAAGATGPVSMQLAVPTTPGHYRSTYQLSSTGGFSKGSFWVDFVVPSSPSTTPNRQAVTSYNQMHPGAPHHGYFATSWQSFIAASNTITWISATVGNPTATVGAPLQGSALTIRICTDPNCSGIVAEAHPQIVNYGETGADIGDISVTPGATYYVVWYQPSALNGSTWVTYWWGGGNTISTSDLMQAAVRGYNR